jgi:hypothetical protein
MPLFPRRQHLADRRTQVGLLRLRQCRFLLAERR